MKHLLLFSMVSMILIGCGASEENRDRTMTIGESYSVSKGDKIVKTSEETLLKIKHTSGKETSTVSLLEGNATITHPKQK